MGLVFTVLEQTGHHGELGLKISTLASAPPVGLSQLDRIYALTEDSGLHLLDGGSLLPNGGAEFEHATAGTCQCKDVDTEKAWCTPTGTPPALPRRAGGG